MQRPVVVVNAGSLGAAEPRLRLDYSNEEQTIACETISGRKSVR
jgi:hypothetical protein